MKRTASILITLLMLFSALPLSVSALTPDYTPSTSYKSSSYYTALTNVSLTGDYHTDLVAVAASQIGYHESNSSSKLSGNSSGSNNYTEYGYWFGGNGNPWCAYFISYCARQAGIPTDTIANTGLAAAYYFDVTWNERSDYTPKKGDLIFFDYSPYSTKTPRSKYGDHVGVVEDFDGIYVYTIEGNSNNSVERCKYEVDDSTIKGYGTYSSPVSSIAETEPESEVVSILKTHIGFKASLAQNTKVNAYSNYGGSKVGRVYESDIFTVNEIKYHNNEWWAKIACPWAEGGRSFTKTVYIKLIDIVPDLNYDAWMGTANCQITSYKHSDKGSTTGYVGNGDTVYAVSEVNGAGLVLYPLAGGGYKLGWI